MSGDPAGKRGNDEETGIQKPTQQTNQFPVVRYVLVQNISQVTLGLAVATLVLIALEWSGLTKIGWTLLGFTVAIMSITQSMGIAFQHFPQGAELVLFRAGMVAICRTLLPLVVFAMMAYNGRFQLGPAWGLAVVGLYLMPLLCTLIPVLRTAIGK